MVTYLDLLPIDIQEIIEKNVHELYLEEHKEKMRDIQIELSSFWLIALWGSGFGRNCIVKNLYQTSKGYQHSLVKQYTEFINYIKDTNILSFPKPKTINYIMNNYKLNDSNPHKN